MGLRAIVAALAAGPLVLVAQQAIADLAVRGDQLAAMCAACHRLDGRDQGIPSIIGLAPKELIATMAEFRSGARPGQIMHAVAFSLSDTEVAAVAQYLSALDRGSP